jgi:hypothetical protein
LETCSTFALVRRFPWQALNANAAAKSRPSQRRDFECFFIALQSRAG